ncbi:hypothetical protein [Streptomyces sp. NEAU-174]|uniref:hypothetical protein n=1 Tax=Streptomyces sp. NEAU-174 TaxID=3458254 RepID=UPI004043C139
MATTTVSVLGGTTTDEFGDEKDTETPLATGIPASLMEATRQAFEPVTGTPRIVRTHVCRLSPATSVTEENRIRDEQSGEIYIVVSVTRNANPVMAQPLRLDLKRTGRAA